MDEHELRRAFHETFDRAQPRHDAADRAFQAVAESLRERGAGRWLAGAATGVLALLVIGTLLISRGAVFAPQVAPAGRPEPSQAPLPPNVAPPVQVAALDGRVALVSWGQAGTVMLTRDAGATWTNVDIPIGPALSDLQWTDGDTAYAATSMGLYLFQLSTRTWRPLSSRTDLVRLDFIDRTTGYAVTAAGDVVRSDDGGATFAARDVGLHPVSWLQWVSTTQAWAAGPDGIVTTSDGGATWVRQLSLPAGPAALLVQVGFRDARNGFALVDQGGSAPPRVLHTSDGGVHWIEAPVTAPAGAHGPLVVTGPAQALLVSTDESAGASSICSTGDGGQSWKCKPAPYAGSGDSAALAVKGLTWLLVGPGLPIAVSRDAGDTWAIHRP